MKIKPLCELQRHCTVSEAKHGHETWWRVHSTKLTTNLTDSDRKRLKPISGESCVHAQSNILAAGNNLRPVKPMRNY